MPYLELLQHNPVLYLSLVFVLGLLVGSFLNVVIYRLPRILKQQWRSECISFLRQEGTQERIEEPANAKPFNLVIPRSSCPTCGHQITALENIPVLSFLILRGRCRQCQTPIPLRYPLVELLSAILVTLVAWKFGVTVQALAAIFLTWALIALAFIDFDTRYLPDNITLPYLWAGLFLGLFGVFADLPSAVMGAIAGYVTLWTVFQVFKLITGKEGMGYGDFKLLALLGAWLGWQALPGIILLSSVVGTLAGISLILFKKHARSHPIPFGPYLAIAGWIALLWGTDINSAYLNWIAA
ncbi:MAG TPA: prepilin peptidase [Chromatiales bacterium]|nr:prepilin peptidase [Chromatiales bacterium]